MALPQLRRGKLTTTEWHGGGKEPFQVTLDCKSCQGVNSIFRTRHSRGLGLPAPQNMGPTRRLGFPYRYQILKAANPSHISMVATRIHFFKAANHIHIPMVATHIHFLKAASHHHILKESQQIHTLLYRHRLLGGQSCLLHQLFLVQ
mmetsp:Transcript_34085/g.69602  ORF Transcript_34085/g.69602 Transcript_34085/m.69602 type:complete len:147 (+) Transcript_34085:559-999(+)